MNLKKLSWGVVILMVLMVLQTSANASPKGVVNILARYNYLGSPEIASLVKDKCGVEISYDEFFSFNDCMARISTFGDFYYYDIVIFPSLIYGLIETKIKRINSNLNQAVKDYSDLAKKRYLSHGYPSNVVYFALSVSGFIWNPEVIKISADDSIASMFEKAKNNIVIIINSPLGTKYLIDNNGRLSIGSFAKEFGKLILDADIYITNGYNKLYDRDNFAFAYQRSGDAAFVLKASKNKSLSFFVHPKYSYVVPDLMAELNTRTETQCVARVLASKKVLDIVQKETGYLSPYGTYKSLNDPVFQDTYSQLFDRVPKIRWLDSFFAKNTANEGVVRNSWRYRDVRGAWDKIHMLPQVMKNHILILKRKPACSGK
jgi:hypothetical protein